MPPPLALVLQAMPVVPSASASKDIEQAVATIDEAIVRAYLVRHPEAAA